jgi:hypothetical protein
VTLPVTPPRLYAEWLPLIDRFQAGDDTILPALESGRIDWTNGVAEGITRATSKALADRFQRLSAELQQRLSRARTETDTAQALVWVRHQLPPLHRFANLPCLDARLRAYLDDTGAQWVRRTQSSLEDSLTGSAGHSGLRLLLRGSPLTWGASPGGTSAPSPSDTRPFDFTPRRRPLLP